MLRLALPRSEAFVALDGLCGEFLIRRPLRSRLYCGFGPRFLGLRGERTLGTCCALDLVGLPGRKDAGVGDGVAEALAGQLPRTTWWGRWLSNWGRIRGIWGGDGGRVSTARAWRGCQGTGRGLC